MLELVISHTTATDNWIKRHHYLHSTPAGAVIRMEFWIPAQEAVELCTEADLSGERCLAGAMLWGRPVSPQIDQKHILELTRCCFLDFMPPNTESFCLAKARTWIRKYKPEIKGLTLERLLDGYAQHHQLPWFSKALLVIDEWSNIQNRRVYDQDNKGWKAIPNILKGRVLADDDQYRLEIALLSRQDEQPSCHIFILPAEDADAFFTLRSGTFGYPP